MNAEKNATPEAVSGERPEDTPTKAGTTPTEPQLIPTEVKPIALGAEPVPTEREVKPTLLGGEPTLTDATVLFHTLDENKDHDTHVTVTVRQLDGTVAARISNDFGEFRDHNDNGPFNLVIENTSPKSALRAGNVTIRIDPVGNDTWRFNFFLSLGFSDGSHLSSGADGLELAQDRQQQSFGIA